MRMKKIMSIHEISDEFVVIFLFLVVSFPNLCFSQYIDYSPKNIETFYPGWPSFPPSPSPSPSPTPTFYSPPPPQYSQPPTEPPSPSRHKAIITAVGVTAASALVVAALLFFLVAKTRRSRKETADGASRRTDGIPPALPVDTIGRSRSEFARGNTREFVVDEEGLDAVYWDKLKASKGAAAGGGFKKLSISSSRSRIHPDPVRDSGDRKSSVSLQALPRQQSVLRSRAVSEEVVSVQGSATQIDQLNNSKDESQYSEDITKAYIFGTLAKDRTSSKDEDNIESSNPNVEIFILDPTKSHNTTVMLKSLGIPPESLVDALLEGKGLTKEALEKLTSVAPTNDEITKILAFNGDRTRLADAESFLYTVLTSFPPAFTRAHQMLFKLNYDSEMTQMKDSLQTLELACEELRNRGIFLNLLEAIHKAGTRLSVGNLIEQTKPFKISTLKRLCDYKSSDGKTTLLHFVVHQTVRNEGRRCVLARNNSISRQNSTIAQHSENEQESKEKKEKEFLMLGLPVIGGLSSEFTNVKNAANIDYVVLKNTLDSVVNRVKEARKLEKDDDGGFEMDIRGFLESVEVEIKATQDEYTRVMKIVKKATQYYQAGSLNDENPFQLFVTVKDFLGMIDQTCVEVARSLQKQSESESESSVLRTRVNFPKLPENFFSDASTTSLSDES